MLSSKNGLSHYFRHFIKESGGWCKTFTVNLYATSFGVKVEVALQKELTLVQVKFFTFQ